MTIQSLSRRLRLFFLSLSLFCSGAAVLPQEIPSAPDIEIVSQKWTMDVFKPGVSRSPAISSQTIQMSDKPYEPMSPQVPTPNVSAKPIERQSYTYSAELRNRGQKEIKALRWSYVFNDKLTHEELKRLPSFGGGTLHPGEKKSMRFTSFLSPPRLVNANSPDATSPFEEHVVIECVQFADGSFWANPQAKAGVCAPEPPLGISLSNVKMETFITTSSAGSVAGAPDSNPNRLPLPVDGSAVRVERKELHVYSMELSNPQPIAIKALAWDFIFANPDNQAEVLRRSFANLQTIGAGEKKTVRFTTALSPPKVVAATTLGRDPKARFGQYAILQCVMWAGGETWELPQAAGKPCDRLRRWIEQRKKSQPGLEDLPFSP